MVISKSEGQWATSDADWMEELRRTRESNAALLAALKGLVSPDGFSVYFIATPDVIAAALAAIAKATLPTVPPNREIREGPQ